MIFHILYFIDPLLFLICIVPILYMLVFVVASIRTEEMWHADRIRKNARFLFITTACSYDVNVERTIKSVLAQKYDRKLFDMIVVGDRLTPLLNMKLAQYPITFMHTQLEDGNKINALKYAVRNMPPLKIYDMVVLLDPDETVGTDFLDKVNRAYQSGYRMIQAHRVSLDRSSHSRVFAATFEEINNAVFRIGHNNLGMSAALVGSAFCADFNWFRQNIFLLSSDAEEKEMEILLLKQRQFVDYADNIYVYVQHMKETSDFNAQRRRWSHAQWVSFKKSIHLAIPSLIKGNYDLLDKIFQWMLISRIMLLGIMLIMSIALPFFYWSMALKWWIALLLFLFICAIGTPDYIVDKTWQKNFIYIPVILVNSILFPFNLPWFKKMLTKPFRRKKKQKEAVA